MDLRLYPHLLSPSTLRVRHGAPVDTPKGPMEITELSFLVDEPRALVTRARYHLASGDLRL